MVAGFCEHWAPDMEDIWACHCTAEAGGNFFVATQGDGQGSEEFVGCVGAVPHDQLTVELHRMSVARIGRGRGVGERLISALEQWAVSAGFAQVFLTTWAGSCKGTRAPSGLYSRVGYQLVQQARPRVFLKARSLGEIEPR
jgi:GNAT superfamily N-acetyltransferase